MKNNMQKFRKEKNYSQSKFADEIGVTTRYISMIETGARTPGFKLSKKIADKLGKTVDEIFFGIGQNETKDEILA